MLEANPESTMVDLPEVEAYYMVEIFISMDFAKVMPMGGLGPLSHMDVDAWSRVYGVDLAMWEVDTLMSMSKAYVSGYIDYNEKDVGPPVVLPGREPTEEQRQDIHNRMKSVLGRRRRKKPSS